MSESRFRILRFLSQFTKVFCIVHASVAFIMIPLVDVEPHFIRVLVCIMYCMVIACILGMANCLIDEEIDRVLDYE